MKNTDDETRSAKSKKTKILNFINKNAIYGIFAVVLIAVLAIAVLSIPGANTDIDTTPVPTKIADADPKTTAPTIKPTVKPTTKPTVIPTTPTPSTPVPTDDPDEDPSEDVGKDKKTTFTVLLPFEKKSIITAFSNEKPIYSETLNEWACHCGIDLQCNADDEINSAANGIISSIQFDSLYGYTVTIEHQDGFSTLYRGLKTVSVSNDELVSAGQVIGTALGNIPYEGHMDDHVHFELSKDSVKVDPLSFVK